MIFSENRYPLFGIMLFQGVAQPGSAPGLEPGGRRFKSCRPDHFVPPKTRGGCHATPRLRRTAALSRPRASGGGGYASEMQVRRGDRVVHGDKELSEKLGRNDLCPCGSGRRFQEMLPALRPPRRQRAELLRPRLAHATESTKFCPRSPIGRGPGLNPGQCGFDARRGYARVAQRQRQRLQTPLSGRSNRSSRTILLRAARFAGFAFT
jgi:hypothetical protein